MEESMATRLEQFTHFEEEVEAVLSDMNLKEDSLDCADFDVVSYINEIFPTEQSLSNIDEVIADTQKKIADLERDTRDIIQGRLQSEEEGQEMAREAMEMIKTLFTRIHDVQDRATRSEQMVHEITKDIQQLDQAKRNLTVSITTLNNLILIVNALDRLNELLHIKPTHSEKATDPPTSSNPFDDGKTSEIRQSSGAAKSEKLTLSTISEMQDFLAQVQRLMQPMLAAYHMIPSITGLARELDQIHSTLSEKFTKELKVMLSGSRSASENSSLILAACGLVELLPESLHVKQQILDWFIGRQLGEYRELFDPSQTAAWVDKISHRYAWLRSNLPAIERKFQLFFPPNWHVTEELIVEFCRITKSQLKTVMRRRQAELSHNLIIFGIQQTLSFESSLNKVYPNYVLPKRPLHTSGSAAGDQSKPANPFDEDGADATDAPKETDEAQGDQVEDSTKHAFDGLISSCFDDHFDLYLNHVEKALRDQLQNRLIGDFTLNKFTLSSRELSDVFKDAESSTQLSTSSDSGEYTLYSATELFLLYKQVIKQTLQLNRGPGFLGLVQLLRQYLSEYNMWVLLAQIPGISLGQSGSTTAGTSLFNPEMTAKVAAFGLSGLSALGLGRNVTASSQPSETSGKTGQRVIGTEQGGTSIQQLLTNLMREDQQATRLSKEDVRKVCIILVTAAFCFKTVEDLEKRLKMEVRSSRLASQISFATELDGFSACRSVCVHRLLSDLEAATEPQLGAMARLPWNNLVQVGDQSVYVTEIVKHLRTQVPVIRDILFSVRATFTQICIKFADTLIARFIASLYRCKPLNTFGAEQLLLDAQSLKSALLQMPIFGAKFAQPPPRSFTNLIHEGLGRAERIIKAVMLPVGSSPSVAPKQTSDIGGSVPSTGFIMGPIDAKAAEVFLASYRQLIPEATATDLQKVLDMKGVKTSEQQLILNAFRTNPGSSQ